MCKILKVVPNTLRTWERDGKIKCIRTSGGHRRYFFDEDIDTQGTKNKKKICYCRVSSSGQKEDLDRQVKYLKDQFPDFDIIKDIGSGINFKRKGLRTILELAKEGNLETLVVTYKDRLCRFGFEFFEWAIKEWSNGEILVLNKKESSPEKELTEDLISIITVFSSRIHGLRSYKIKEQIKEASGTIKVQDSRVPVITN